MINSSEKNTSKHLIDMLNYSKNKDSLKIIEKAIDDILDVLSNDFVIKAFLKSDDSDFESVLSIIKNYIKKGLFEELCSKETQLEYFSLNKYYRNLYYNIEKKQFTFKKGYHYETLILWSSQSLNIDDLDSLIGFLLNKNTKYDILKRYLESISFAFDIVNESINEFENSFVDYGYKEKLSSAQELLISLINNNCCLELFSSDFINDFISVIFSNFDYFNQINIEKYQNRLLSFINEDNLIIILNDIKNIDGRQKLISLISDDLFYNIVKELDLSIPFRFKDIERITTHNFYCNGLLERLLECC